MGLIHLRFPDHMQFDGALPASIHVLGMDGIAGPCRISREGQRITIARNRDESGHVYLAWPTDEWGELVLATGTLPESDHEYPVATELARGTANRLRNQISIWEEGGLEIPAEVMELADRASQLLASSILHRDGESSGLSAIRSIELAVRGIFLLAGTFSRQILPLRLQGNNRPFWMGVQSSDGADREWVNQHFDLVFTQAPVASTVAEPIPLVIGPLVDMAPGGLPEEIRALEGFESRLAGLLRSGRQRLEGLDVRNVRMIHAVAGLNGTGHRHMGYSQQLQATLDLLQLCEEIAGKTPVLISFDNPWGERLARSVGGTHPLQIADSLLRRGVRISALGLEINLDFNHRGSLCRDPLQWLEMLDLWGQLGLPLVVMLRAPTGIDSDCEGVRPSMTDRQRLVYLQTILPLILCRPSVQGLVWQELRDREADSLFPGAGLLGPDRGPKPISDLLDRLREDIRSSQNA